MSNEHPAARYAVYVSNADSAELIVLHLDAQGTAPEVVQRLPAGGTLMPLALSPPAPLPRFIYAARRSDPCAVLTFAIDHATGLLTPLGEAPLPNSMAYIATDRSGRRLFSASYGANQIAVSAIDGNGRVQPAHQVLPTPPHAHAIEADPSNRYVFATSLGGGVVLQFNFDSSTGRLAPNAEPAYAPHADASPRHFVFAPDGRVVYLLNELDATIDVLAFDDTTGTLRTQQTTGALPPGFAGEPWAADLRLTPDGRWLYASERRSSVLAAFAVDRTSGTLTALGHVDTETQPRGFNITPDGRYLMCCGQLSDRLSVYRIDPQSGALSRCGECALGRNPNWVESVALTS